MLGEDDAAGGDGGSSSGNIAIPLTDTATVGGSGSGGGGGGFCGYTFPAASTTVTTAANANATAIPPRGDCFSENGDRVLFVPYSELDEMKAVNRDIYRGDRSKAIIFDHKLKVWIIPANRGINESLYQKWLTPSGKWIQMNSKSPFIMQAAAATVTALSTAGAAAKSNVVESANGTAIIGFTEEKETQGLLSKDLTIAIEKHISGDIKCSLHKEEEKFFAISDCKLDADEMDNEDEKMSPPLAIATSEDVLRALKLTDLGVRKYNSSTVVARNLDCRIFDDKQLEIVFSPFGPIVSMELEKDASSEHKNLARVFFESSDSAAECIEALNGKRFDRFKISVSM
jgi:hypothetical protein